MKDSTYRLVKVVILGIFALGVLVIGWLHLQNGRYEVLSAREHKYYYYIIVDKWDRKVKEEIHNDEGHWHTYYYENNEIILKE